MSVLMEFAMFPTDKGESVSAYVARIVGMINSRGVEYHLTPMGTIVEMEDIGEALGLVAEAYGLLEPDCGRVYATVKLDIRKGQCGRIGGKVISVEKRLGRRLKTR
jgi:uncharacterized protein (TIGR00106 family)